MSMFPRSPRCRPRSRCSRSSRRRDVPVRIGVHVGEVVVEPERPTREAVNIASRIESFGVTGGVMLARTSQAASPL